MISLNALFQVVESNQDTKRPRSLHFLGEGSSIPLLVGSMVSKDFLYSISSMYHIYCLLPFLCMYTRHVVLSRRETVVSQQCRCRRNGVFQPRIFRKAIALCRTESTVAVLLGGTAIHTSEHPEKMGQ